MGTEPMNSGGLVRLSPAYAKGAIVERTREQALSRLRAEQRAGLIHSAGKLVRIERGPGAGQYAIPVYLIANPRPARRRVPRWVWGLTAAVVVPGGVIAGVVWAVSVLISGVAGALSTLTAGTVVGGAFVLLVIFMALRRARSAVSVTVKVDVR